jgi:uncharacterized protein (DUF1778 family)
MTRDYKVTFYLDEEEAELLEEAAIAVSLSKSTFSRTHIIQEARKIVGENNGEKD